MKVYLDGHNIPRRTFLKMAAGAMASSALAACVPAAAPAEPAAEEMGDDAASGCGGEVVVATEWENPLFNPLCKSAGTPARHVFEPIFNRLFEAMDWGPGPDCDGEVGLTLSLAEKVEEVEKNRVWMVDLRQDVNWHDGRPFTADDVVWTYYAMLHRDVAPTYANQFLMIKGGKQLFSEGGDSLEGVQKIDQYKVRIEFDEPDPLGIVGSPVSFGRYWYVTPKHGWEGVPLEKVGTHEPMAMSPIGTGPFKMGQIVERQYAELVANEDYFLGKPLADKYITRFLGPEARDAALEGGEVMQTGASSLDAWDRLGRLPHLTAYTRPTTLMFALDVNDTRWGDMAHTLAEAIRYAIDIGTILQDTSYGTNTPSRYIFEHILGPVGEPPDGLKTYEYNTERAREVLENAGWDFDTELEWSYWRPPDTLDLSIQAQLLDAGIKTKFRIIDVASWTEDIATAANYDLYFDAWMFSTDMQEMSTHIGCGWGFTSAGRNYDFYCNEELDAAWQAALAEEDPEAQIEMYRNLALILQEKWPWAPMYRRGMTTMVNNRLQGVWPHNDYQRNVRVPFERMCVTPA